MSLEPAATDIAALLAPRDPATRLRLASTDDEPFLRDFYKCSRAADFAGAGLPPAVLDKLLDQQYCAQAAGYATQSPDAVSLIILRHDAPVGRLLLEPGDRRWRIVDIALLPAARGQGLSSEIIDAVGRAASAHGANELGLAVLTGNVAARRLYARLGFAAQSGDGARIAMVKPLK